MVLFRDGGSGRWLLTSSGTLLRESATMRWGLDVVSLDVVPHLVGNNPSGRGRVGMRSGVFQGGRGGHPSCNSSSVTRRPFLSGSLVVLVTQLMSLL